MGYREKRIFDQPSPEDMAKSQRSIMWIAPALLIQQGSFWLRDDIGVGRQIFYHFAWVALTVSILSVLMGWGLNWMSREDHAKLNDEWYRSTRNEAMRWAVVAMVVIGCALSFADIWIDVGSRMSINLVMGGALATAGVRYAWLNRTEPEEDE